MEDLQLHGKTVEKLHSLIDTVKKILAMTLYVDFRFLQLGHYK
jgi:hypothetical protein